MVIISKDKENSWMKSYERIWLKSCTVRKKELKLQILFRNNINWSLKLLAMAKLAMSTTQKKLEQNLSETKELWLIQILRIKKRKKNLKLNLSKITPIS